MLVEQESLARRTVAAGSLWILAAGASSPLTVAVAGVPTMFAATGVTGVPLSFAVLAVVLCLLAVGYTAMGRHLPHAAPFYVILGRGLGEKAGPVFGVAGAAVALLGYNAIQLSLYGVVGTTCVAVFHAGRWWWWAVGVWAIVGLWGLLSGASSAKLLGGILAAELGVIASFVALAFIHPAGGHIRLDGLLPSRLAVGGFAGVMAFGMAAMVGTETPSAYGEEAQPGTAGRATLWAAGLLGGFYLLVGLAFSVWTGPANVVAAAGPASLDPSVGPLALIGQVWGPGWLTLALFQYVLSIVVSMIAFHGVVARYVFGLARKGLLPKRLRRVTRTGQTARGGAPKGGSIAQTVFAGLVLAVVVVVHADPITIVFTWFSTVGALSIMTLLVASAVAVMMFFYQRGGGTQRESRWVRWVAPIGGGAGGLFLLGAMVFNLAALLGTPPGSSRVWLAPEIVAGTALAGLLLGLLLRAVRPAAVADPGAEVPHALLAQDARLARLEM